MSADPAFEPVRPHRLGEVYMDADQIAARVGELGKSIAADYAGRDLLLVIVLRGAVVFGSDLSRATPIPHALDFVSRGRLRVAVRRTARRCGSSRIWTSRSAAATWSWSRTSSTRGSR